jgi:transposase InsO family protein
MSRKNKIAIVEKARITREYTAGYISREEAAKRAGVVSDVITDWARIYRREGTLGLEPEEKNRVYSPELKKQAVLEYLSVGYSKHSICEKYEIRSRSQLRSWIEMYKYSWRFQLRQVLRRRKLQGRCTTREERIQIVRDCIASGKNHGEMALKAVMENPGAHPLFHSDRGFQYTGRQFHRKLVDAGMIQSMSRVGRCLDNGPMEGFWGIIKREKYYGRKFTSRDDLVSMIVNYIDYYNNR